jgi:hypothetical protein
MFESSERQDDACGGAGGAHLTWNRERGNVGIWNWRRSAFRGKSGPVHSGMPSRSQFFSDPLELSFPIAESVNLKALT